LPADWTSLGIDNLRVGENKLQLNFTKTVEGIFLEARRTAGSTECFVEFRPAISLRATVNRVELNGKPVPFRTEANDEDQHVVVRFSVAEGQKSLRVYVSNDFGIGTTLSLPALGSISRGLRVLSETWSPSHDQLTLDLSGTPGAQYELQIWDSAQIQKVDGAELMKKSEGSVITVQIPSGGSENYGRTRVVIHFADVQTKAKRRQKS